MGVWGPYLFQLFLVPRSQWTPESVELIPYKIDEENKEQILEELIEVIYDYFAKLGNHKAFSTDQALATNTQERIRKNG